ncbi:hypothetical protein EDD85DRAFT_7304 [Armillaria nabsnona]|nr:hypothetical protein EDD85DRAFT_7304 [Armillaria nabsnona]
MRADPWTMMLLRFLLAVRASTKSRTGRNGRFRQSCRYSESCQFLDARLTLSTLSAFLSVKLCFQRDQSDVGYVIMVAPHCCNPSLQAFRKGMYASTPI